MEPFKNIYNKKSIQKIAKLISLHHPAFDVKSFERTILKNLQELEMKQRVELISSGLFQFLPKDYKQATSIMLATMKTNKNKPDGLEGFILWPYSHYVESYGLDDLKTSTHMMLEITKVFTSEFCIRAYLHRYPQEMYKTLRKWALHKNEHVRRLVSEGTRPNLPWGRKVDYIKENLDQNLELLEMLKYDKSQYVQKSISNHLNDISRLDKNKMLKVCNRWDKDPLVPKKTIRHACRTLLKSGDKTALKLHGYNPNLKLELKSFSLSKKQVTLGKSMDLALSFKTSSKKPQKVILEYIIHFLKKNGDHSPKPFRLKDSTISSSEPLSFTKTIKLANVTTRKHYSGLHYIEIQVNGKSYIKTEFKLKV